MACPHGTAMGLTCVKCHLSQVWAGIRMREIKKQLRVEYRPDVAVKLRVELREQTRLAQGKVDAEINVLADIAR